MTLDPQSLPAASLPADDSPVAPAQVARPRTSLLKAHLDLTKFRLNAMVVFTTALGFLVGSQVPLEGAKAGFGWERLFWTCLGTFLAAAGASTFNQAIEAPRDARMHRTRKRPLCTGRLSRNYAATLGLILSIIGVAILCPMANGLTAILAAGNVLLYAFIYTPLKPVSTVNTLVGAIVGGVPPVIGWAAATGRVSAGAMVLGAILFVWQIPHFLALCWIYREDYARGGFKMLPILDASGKLTSRMALIYALLLVPLCVLVTALGHAGIIFVAVSLILTAGFLAVAMRFMLTRSNRDARLLFFASIIYLPLLCMTLMADARAPSRYQATLGGLTIPDPHPETFQDPSQALEK